MHSETRYKVRVSAIAVISIAAIAGLIVLFPSILLGPSAFGRSRVFEYSSPDGQFKIAVFRQVNFPASEIIDPAGTVTVALIKAENNSLLDRVEFQVVETGDLTEPAIVWSRNEVLLDRIEYRNNIQLRFRLPDSQSGE